MVGAFRHVIEVSDSQGQHFETLEALVDTGATFTTLPGHVLDALGVERVRQVRLRLADNRVVERDAGETFVRLDSQTVWTIVLFGDGDDPVLLGVYTLEGALLAVDPVRQRLVPTEGLLMVACRW